MKEYDVSLDILSGSKSLAELADELRIEPSDGSHDRGEARLRERKWETTRLRIDSGVAEREPIEAHLASLIAIMPDLSTLTDVELVLTIAVFFDYPMTSVVIPLEMLSATQLGRCTLEVVAYVTDFSSS